MTIGNDDRQSLLRLSQTCGRPSGDQVNQQLSRILQSRAFRGSAIARNFLEYVVREALAGREARLKESGIAIGLLGRSPRFDGSTDPIVRVQANRVRQLLEHYYLGEGVADPLRIVIPRGGYVPLFSLTTVSPAPHGPEDEQSQPCQPIVAVLPLLDLTDGTSHSSIDVGLSQELLSALARFEGFRFLPWASKSTDVGGAWEARNGLDLQKVHFLLTGTVYRTSDTESVTVLLNDARSGDVIWSESFLETDGHRSPQYQRDLSTRIAAVVADMHGVICRAIIRQWEGIPTNSMPYGLAFIRYGNVLLRSRDEHAEILQVLERALARIPDSSLANAFLAEAYIRDYNYVFENVSQPLDRALSLAQRAVALNRTSQRAELILAHAHIQRRELDEFFIHAEQTLRLNPDCSGAVGLVGQWMTVAGEWEEGTSLVRRAMELNPSYMRYLHFVPFLDHYRRGEYHQALVQAHLFNAPGFFWGPLVRAAALGQIGQHKEGEAAVRELLTLRSDFGSRAREITGRFVPPELLDQVMEGLVKAGFTARDRRS